MSFSSWISFLSTLLLSLTVLRSGLGKLTSQVTNDVHERYLAEDKGSTSKSARLALSKETVREARGVIDLICGILLLVPSWRIIGAALAFALLVVGLIRCVKNGNSLVPSLVMMALSALVWVL